MDALLEDLLESNFIANVVAYRIKNDIYNLRAELDHLRMLERKHEGLTQAQDRDTHDLWNTLEGMTRAYIYYSGDCYLDDLDEWV